MTIRRNSTTAKDDTTKAVDSGCSSNQTAKASDSGSSMTVLARADVSMRTGLTGGLPGVR